MAEQQTGSNRVDTRQAAQQAAAYLGEMIGQQPEVVSAVEPDEEGWLVTAELLEFSKIPNSCDVLGCYQVSVNADGEPVAFRRLRRYYRGHVDEVRL